MILGRNPALFAGLIQALINVVVAIGAVLGTPIDGALVAALNSVGIAIIAVLANEADPSTLSTFAPSITPPDQKA